VAFQPKPRPYSPAVLGSSVIEVEARESLKSSK